MIADKEIGMMKDGVRLINCARGGIIDEQALAAALSPEKSPAPRWMCMRRTSYDCPWPNSAPMSF
jgi:hypothetical protein